MATLDADYPEEEMASERVVLHVVDEGAGGRCLVGNHVQLSERFSSGPWRGERIDSASHRIPLGAPEYLHELLVDFLSADGAR